jgi:hypothetical protein
MAVSHWDAFLQIPILIQKDFPAILFHAFVSKVDEFLIRASESQYQPDSIVAYLIDGLSYTVRQDYAFGLIDKDITSETAEIFIQPFMPSKRLPVKTFGLADDQRDRDTINRINTDVSRKPGYRAY